MLLFLQKDQTFCEGQPLPASLSVSPVLFQGEEMKFASAHICQTCWWTEEKTL